MKKLLALLVFISVLTGACSTSTPSPVLPPTGPTATPVSGNTTVLVTESVLTPTSIAQTIVTSECTNPLYRVQNDAWWMYTRSDGSQLSHTMFVNADNTFKVVIQGLKSTFTVNGQCTNAGIILFDISGISAVSLGGQNNSALTAQNVEGVTLPNNVQAGDSWSQTISMLDKNLSATFVINYQAVGYEAITVPAGAFHALKVEQNGTLNKAGQVSNTHAFMWYAQDIGLVKSLPDSASAFELFAYNFP